MQRAADCCRRLYRRWPAGAAQRQVEPGQSYPSSRPRRAWRFPAVGPGGVARNNGRAWMAGCPDRHSAGASGGHGWGVWAAVRVGRWCARGWGRLSGGPAQANGRSSPGGSGHSRQTDGQRTAVWGYPWQLGRLSLFRARRVDLSYYGGGLRACARARLVLRPGGGGAWRCRWRRGRRRQARRRRCRLAARRTALVADAAQLGVVVRATGGVGWSGDVEEIRWDGVK